MHKLIAIPLFLGLLIYESGHLLVYLFKQQEIRQEVRAYINLHPKELGTTFNFELMDGKAVYNNNVRWIEKDEEFMFDGEMYDVISMSSTNNKLTIHAIADGAEKALKQSYQKHQKAKHGLSLSEFATALFLPVHTRFNLNAPEKILTRSYSCINVGFNQMHIPVIVTPPDNILIYN